MKPQEAQRVYDEIVVHIKEQGGAYSTWYCGITSDWENRLFNEHKVPQKDHWYIVRQCYNDNAARNVEKHCSN